MVGSIRNPKSTITVHIRAENPASRIQIIDSKGEAMLPEAATGELSHELRPHETYSILHWIGSGLRFSVEWNSDNQPRFIVLPDTFFLTAAPLSNSDQQDQRSHAYAIGCFSLANKRESGGLLLFARSRIGDGNAAAIRHRSSLPTDIRVGWAFNNQLHTRDPTTSDAGDAWTDTLLTFRVPSKEQGHPVLAMTSPRADTDWIFRCLPMLGRHFPTIFMCASIPQAESELPIDWRRAIYSVYLGEEPVIQYLKSPEARFEEALIDRLGKPGIPSRVVRQFIEGRGGGNLIAQLAGWLMCAREVATRIPTHEYISGAFGRWIGKATHLQGLADVKALQYFWRSTDSKHFYLSPPVFSATWNLLAQVPLSVWAQSKIEISQQTWQIANFSNSGGLWFSFFRGVDAPHLNGSRLNEAIEAGPQSAIRLIERISDAARESKNRSEEFGRLLGWSNRTLLERRVLDQIIARGIVVPENEGDGCTLIEEFARSIGIPAPIVALSVDKLAGKDWNSESPPPAPSVSPTGAVLNQSTDQSISGTPSASARVMDRQSRATVALTSAISLVEPAILKKCDVYDSNPQHSKMKGTS